MAQEFNLGALGQFLSVDITGNNISFAANNLTVGNSTVNSSFNSASHTIGTTGTGTGGLTTNSTTLFIGNNTVNAVVSTSGVTVGSFWVTNSTGAYTTGTVNSASHTVGTTWVANASGVYMTMPLSANGGTGTAGQLLYSNGATGSPYWAAAPANYTISTGLVNTTGTITVNASYIATIAANNASYLGGTAAASYQLNSTLAANVAALPANNASYLGGVAATNYLRTDSSKDITESVYLRFGSANQSDGNDGKIGAGLFSNGLNIVGTQTQTGNGREISYYGKLYDRSALGASILGTLTTGNTITVGTSAYFVANGNFGIGTNSPISKLNISGSFSAGTVGNYPVILGGGTYGGGIGFQDGTAVSGIYTQSSGTNLVFFTGQTSADTAASKIRMLIDGSGNVGIGTTSPGGKLDVQAGNTYFTVAPTTYTSATVGPRPAGDGTSSFVLQANSTASNKFDSTSSGLTVYVNNIANLHSVFSTNGNFGIANTAPSVKLHVTGNSYISGGLSVGTTSFNRKVNFANGEMTFIPYTAAEGASTNTYFINVSDATGNYGNSMTLNFRALYSSGASSGTLAAITMNTTLLGVTGDVYTAYSDERLKDILGPIDNALSKVQSLTGFYYQPNKTAISLGIEKNQLSRVGVSAQKVREVLPEAVGPAPINEKYLTVQYEKIVPLLIEAIKELSIKIEKLEQRVS